MLNQLHDLWKLIILASITIPICAQWNEVSVPEGSIKLNEISILDDGLAFIALGGAQNGVTEGGVLKTLNYGESWQLIASPASDFRKSMVTVSFKNELTGFVGGSVELFLRTMNGGASWTYDAFDTPESIRRVRWLNDTTVVVMDKAGTLCFSSDLGESWDIDTTLAAAVSNFHQRANTMAFEIIDEYNWIAAGKKGALLKTSNGGQSWSNLYHLAGTPVFQDIDALDVNNWIVVGTSGSALMTQDGGDHFTELNLDPNYTAKFQAVSYADSDNIMIGGITVSSTGYGVIKSTADGGMTWEDENFGGSDIYGFAIRDLHMYEPGLAIAIGDANPGGKVYLLGEHIYYGDVNADSLLNVLDLQRLMEIVTFAGDAANEDELRIIDMNRDFSYDVLDAVLLIEAIMAFNESTDSTSRSIGSVGRSDSDLNSDDGISLDQTKGHRLKRIFANHMRKTRL
ncbi:MAG: hypothetical protein H8E26_07775 [FCB group bacterium]|nr:hypothetical protein [FCB group bacterium]MBL7120401.1 hypothetical protein [Candidatus Neomarinimicrobiota bacterium]